MKSKLTSEFERKLATQMQDLKRALGLEHKDENPSKFSQTNQRDLKEAKNLQKRAKMKKNPTEIIMESLSNLIEHIDELCTSLGGLSPSIAPQLQGYDSDQKHTRKRSWDLEKIVETGKIEILKLNPGGQSKSEPSS